MDKKTSFETTITEVKEAVKKGFFFERRNLLRLVLVFVLFAATSLVLFLDFLPRRLSGLEVGKPSPLTIKANRDIKIVDLEKTQDLREKASGNVKKVYKYDALAGTRIEQNVHSYFNSVREILATKGLTLDAQFTTLRSKVGQGISDAVLRTCLALPADELNSIEAKIIEIEQGILKNTITDRNLPEKKKEFKGLVNQLPFGRTKNAVIAEVGSFFLSSNYFYDLKATEKSRQEAADKVSPIQVKKLEGEVITTEGEVVTVDQAKILSELGLMRRAIETRKVLATLLLVLGVLAIFGGYLFLYQRKIFNSTRLILLLSMILFTVILFAKFVPASYSIYAPFINGGPMIAGAMLTAILLNPHTAFMMVLASTVLTSVVVGSNLSYLIIALLSGLLAIYMVSHLRYRSDLIRSGIAVSLGLAYLCFASSLLAQESYIGLVSNAGVGLISGLTFSLLAGGSLLFLESAFKVTTDIKLLELANPNQALLKDLMINAPGTYNHSIVTGNLAEAAAEYVGANPLLARVGAYYHDIGKLKRPFFFAENQIGGENPHDRTNPNLSTLIITAHVKEGVELAQEYRLPEEIIDIIQEHHGTSLVTYFYHRAKENVEKEEIHETKFRYAGNKPQSKEAALIMLADSVEAAARTITKPSPARIEQLVKKVVRAKLEDGQLDESNLTFNDIDKVNQAFSQVLTSIYHTRIEYPEAEVRVLRRRSSARGNSDK